jgi:hypothetical protein
VALLPHAEARHGAREASRQGGKAQAHVKSGPPPAVLRRQGEKFLKGLVSWRWLERAFRLPGKALHVALLLWREVGCRRSWTVPLCLSGNLPEGLNEQSARRGLRELEGAGLVAVRRPPGRGLEVSYFPTGSIVFTLTGPGGFSSTKTQAVTGNGVYTASTTLPSTGTVAGTYTWTATYGGDPSNNGTSDSNPTQELVTVTPASPTLTTTPKPTTVTLGTTTPPLLTDSATLSGGFEPTGIITFELFANGGSTPVDKETASVSGNGTYTTPTGFTLPGSGTVAGAYQWVAVYSGDANNNEASESNPAEELVTVNPASPALVTTASPSMVTLPLSGSTTLTDSAVLSGGYFPTGSIVFTLTGPNGFSYTQTDPVTGDGPYTASTTLPTTGTVAGTYTWTATYSGDANNAAASDQGGTAEQTVVGAASLTLVTIASPDVTLPSGQASFGRPPTRRREPACRLLVVTICRDWLLSAQVSGQGFPVPYRRRKSAGPIRPPVRPAGSAGR